jgi:putative DNA primase/helicase
MLTESRQQRHSTEIAMLCGMQLALARETDKGQMLNMKRIKRMTGNDTQVGRFCCQDNFTFKQQYTPWLSTNHKPRLRSVEAAIADRIHMIPFVVRIKDKVGGKYDTHFGERLKAEASGILQWAVQGCVQWHGIGLAPPACVQNTTNEYLHDEDRIRRWCEECCTIADDDLDRVSILYRSWRSWCERGNEGKPGSNSQFSKDLQQQGFASKHRNNGNIILGLRLTYEEWQGLGLAGDGYDADRKRKVGLACT